MSNIVRFKKTELVDIVEQAIVETFTKFLRTNVSCSVVKDEDRSSLTREISGVVGLVRNDNIEGTFSVNFTLETLYPILSSFFRKDVNSLDRLTSESVGEMTNMMFGIIKEHLNNHEYGYQMCLPVVTFGNSHDVFSSVGGQRILIEVNCDSGTFWCEMVLHKTGMDAILAAA